MTEHLGWQSIFLLSGGLGIFLVILVFFSLKAEWREAGGEKFDIIGSVTYAIAIGIFMYGFSSLPTTTGIILFIIGLAGTDLFLMVGDAGAQPDPGYLSLFRKNRVFIFSNLAALVTYISTFAITFLLSLYPPVYQRLQSGDSRAGTDCFFGVHDHFHSAFRVYHPENGAAAGGDRRHGL